MGEEWSLEFIRTGNSVTSDGMLLFIGIWRTYQRHCSSCWWITQRKLSWIRQSSVQVWLYLFWHLVFYSRILLFKKQFTLKKWWSTLSLYHFMKCLRNDVLCFLFCRKDLILQLWEQLLELLKRRRSRLEKSMKLQRIFQEMINAIDWMDEIKVVIQIIYSYKPGWLY